MSKFSSFFSNFGKNVKADPLSSIKGLVSLVAAGAVGYGMATGKVPVNQLSLGTISALATSGVHALGTGPAGSDPAATAVISTLETVTAIAPATLTIADHYEEIRKESDKATAVLAAATEVLTALSQQAPVPAEAVKQ